MLQAKTRWVVRETDHKKAEKLVEELNITPLVANLLVNRNIDTVESAERFLFFKQDFYDPFLLNDMDRCVERIFQAIRNNERIVIYGDYDADGVCSTYILLETLHQLGADCDYYIPNRFKEGYGPNEEAFRRLREEGFHLIITVDNGISALHEAKVAKEIGIDLIVTDHHEPGPELPDCLAVIHPKRKDSQYPFRDLAGAGVAFKVATALLGKPPVELLPFAAIGTIADLVPLHDENRLIVKKGLPYIKTTEHIGLQALLDASGIEARQADEDSVAFGLAPRINAPGRLEHAGIVVDLFLSGNRVKAQEIAGEINEYNIERQKLVDDIYNEAVEEINKFFDAEQDRVILIGKEHWHPGVIGIVASRLVEKFYRPVIVFSYESSQGLAKGSARSIPKFNIYENLFLCRDILPHFGGHPMAAGLTLEVSDVDLLRERLNKLAHEQLTEEDLIPRTEIDSVVSLDEISIKSIEEVQMLAPFGEGNPKPKVLIKDVYFPHIRKVGADSTHLKVTMEEDDRTLDGIGFRLGEVADHITPYSPVSVVGEVEINEWNNIRKPQIILKDLAVDEWQLFDYRGNRQIYDWIRQVPEENRKLVVFNERTLEMLQPASGLYQFEPVFSEDDAASCELDQMNVVLVDFPKSRGQLEKLLYGKNVSRIYAHFYLENSELLSSMPTRDHFIWYYAFLRKKGVYDLKRYGKDLARYKGWTFQTIKFMTTVFFELNFVKMNNGVLTIVENPAKRKLTESKTYQRRQEMVELEKELLFSSYKQLKENLDRYIGTGNLEEEKLWI